MKTRIQKKVLVLLIMGIFNSWLCYGQNVTGLSGTGSNGCSAGTAGTDNTSVGCNAGQSNGSGASNNTFIGRNAGNANTVGDANVYVGHAAGLYATGDENTFVGNAAGGSANNTASENTFIGGSCGNGNTTGTGNCYVGEDAGLYNATGSANTLMGWRAAVGNSNFTGNSFFGNEAGNANTASENSFFGTYSGRNNTSGTGNSFFGFKSGYSNYTGTNNSAIGYEAGYYNAAGAANVILGYQAGKGASGQDYSYNSFLGYQAGLVTTTGSSNAFIGYQAGSSNTLGGKNIFMGYQAGSGNSTAGENVAIGYEALEAQTYNGGGAGSAWPSYNTAIGYHALTANAPSSTTTGIKNTSLGYNSGVSNTTGAKNTFIGYGADNAGATTISNATALGYNAIVTTSNSLVLGGTGSDAVNVGIGTTAPAYALDVTAPANNWKAIFQGSDGNITIGPANNAWGHIYTDRANFIFNKTLYTITGAFSSYTSTDLSLQTNGTTRIYASNSNGRVGIATTTPGFTLDINGSANCTTNTWTSDSTKKKDIRELDLDALAIINNLRPVTFAWKKALDNGMHGQQMGFLAQDLEKVIPSMVVSRHDSVFSKHADTTGLFAGKAKFDSLITDKSVKYIELFPVLVRGMQQQQHLIDSLMTMVATQSGAGQRGNNSGTGAEESKKESINHIDLANNNQPILYQNEPNPFNGSTTIRYFVPENAGATFVVFHDMYGKEVNRLEIKEKGFGKIEANTENLANGIYSYSIIVDGKSLDTKKMLKSN